MPRLKLREKIRHVQVHRHPLADSQYDTAVFVSDQAWKLVLILSILALVKRFPYRLFFKTHWLFVPTYLVLIYHAVILLEVGTWTSLL